jgi:hypothetical protein
VVDALSAEEGSFLSLQLLDRNKKVVSDNFYWMPDQKGNYSGLNRMQKTTLKVSTRQLGSNKVEVTLFNSAQNPVAFFNRISLVDAGTKQRILPAFYDDNYVSLPPGAEKKVVVEYTPESGKKYGITISGWNVEASYTDVQ